MKSSSSVSLKNAFIKRIFTLRNFLLFILFSLIGVLYVYPYAANQLYVPTAIPTNISVSKAYFAAGCFWCTESSFEKYPGVIDAISGYAGGKEPDPTYEQVSSSETGHRESVEVIYNPDIISYNDLLQIFWRTANPTDDGGQYIDRGFQYSSAIFYSNESEKQLAHASKKSIAESGRYGTGKVLTPIIPFTTFYPAEDYHQDYYKKNPVRYTFYTNGSGRKEFLEKTWGEELYYSLPNTTDLKARLTPIQYYVTQQDGTEKPYENEYHDNKRAGIYVDIVDGTPLFSSLDKYDSGTGWPSFVKPIDPANVVELPDNTLFTERTEIRSKKADSHLGHMFDDGPADRGGKRYCMNSAALRFIPLEEMENEGYEEYLSSFQEISPR